MSKFKNLAKLYVEKILKGEITIDDVPLFLRKSVEEILKDSRKED